MIKNYKEKAVVLFLMMFVFQLISLMGAPPVSAQVVPDTLCLSVTVTENEAGPLPTPKKFKMNVRLATGNGTYFTIWGKVTVPQDGAFYVGGTGILESTTLTMNLTTSQKHTDAWRDAGVMQVKFNVSTLRGSFYEIANSFDTQNRVFDPMFSAGSLRICP